ncbi:hypothetical protein EON66_08405 [archaeon]|nr:MAG: hypothetical protein EON66_08405 [archaeon]
MACVIAAAWFIFHAVLLYTRWITRDEWLSYVAMQAVAQVSALALAVTNVWVPSTRSRAPAPTKPVSNIARKLERISQLTAQDAVGPRSSRANGGGQLFSMAVAVADHLQRASRAESIVADTHEASVPHLSQAVVSVCSKDVQPSASVVALKSAASPTDASTAARAPDTTSPMTSARRASARQPSWRGMAWPPTPTTATGCEPTV